MKIKLILSIVLLLILNGCGVSENPKTNESIKSIEIAAKVDIENTSKTDNDESESVLSSDGEASSLKTQDNSDKKTSEKESDAEAVSNEGPASNQNQNKENKYPGYRLIHVDGGDTKGSREANVRVDVGFGDREYWAFTNAYGQLVRVIADEIILQDDHSEPVNSDGRYYREEAFVSGVEADDLDQGHVIADSLGGVANAYNITPQNSTLNRHGDQAYMEKVMRQAGGSTNFEAVISYPNTKTQIPSHYKFSYYLNGSLVEHSFANENPEKPKENASKPTETKQPVTPSKPSSNGSGDSEVEELKRVDTNGNNKITIKEAKAAGFKMPISSEHWLYKYMHDSDGDGLVGE